MKKKGKMRKKQTTGKTTTKAMITTLTSGATTPLKREKRAKPNGDVTTKSVTSEGLIWKL